jgi:ribosomal RNA-processing protein 9
LAIKIFISSISTLSKEACVTCGLGIEPSGFVEDTRRSQLIFRAGGGLVLSMVVMDGMRERKKGRRIRFGVSVDVVCMVDEVHFLSGSDSGAISGPCTERNLPLL